MNDTMHTGPTPASSNTKPNTGRDTMTRPLLNQHRMKEMCQPALIVITALFIAMISLLALSQSNAPNIPAIALSADPLYAMTTGDKPALTLALSIEFPTVGAQYVDPDNNNSADDATYSNNREYIGYYDAESCYTYDDTGSLAPPGQTPDYKRFIRRGQAIALTTPHNSQPTQTTRMCWNNTTSYSKDDGTSPATSTTTNDAFSGNFLNWASSSTLDILRLALTGGDRVIDTGTLTVLQRAVIPNGDPVNMWNSVYFPAKRLNRTGTSRAISATASQPYASGVPYFGAVPNAMASMAATISSDIWIANALNKIYFGTRQAGNDSSSAGSYTLGFAASNNSALPNDSRLCATANGVCSDLHGIRESSAALNSDGFFYARVQVCDRDPVTSSLKDNRDYGLCKKYTDGAAPHPQANYKPTGVIQKYSHQLRLAAFGFLLDPSLSRYSGVLRTPMKYVGAKTFDINGLDNTPAEGNPQQEWNPTTGVFHTNPDSNASIQTADGRATYLSGMINYVNQLGRTGSVPGRYKKYDPLGELHYQALRYLQGLQPIPASISNMTPDMYDGFPASSTWTDDPYGHDRSNTSNYSCLKSNIVVVGGVNTGGNNNNSLPSANATNNIPDIRYWQAIAHQFESNTAGSYVDGQGIPQSISNPNSATPGIASAHDTLVGSAYWAHTHDIRGKNWTQATTNGVVGTALQRAGQPTRSSWPPNMGALKQTPPMCSGAPTTPRATRSTVTT